MDMPEQGLSRRLQRTLLAFFLLAALFLVRVYVAAPSIYTNTLLLTPSPTEHYLAAATLLLVGVGVFLAIVMIGVLRRWRWVFCPGLFPVWYSLCRMTASGAGRQAAARRNLPYRCQETSGSADA